MRVTQSMSYRSFLANVENLNSRLEDASQQVSSGKKLNHLKDSPTGSAELVELRSELSRIDQFRSNSDSSNFVLNATDSVLTSVFNLLTDIFTRGSEAASDTATQATRDTILKEIRGMRDQIFSLANTKLSGRSIFAGSRVTAPAFSISDNTVTYLGDEVINTIKISDGVQVTQNVVGSEAFTSVFNTLQDLISAIHAHDSASIKAALGQFSTTFGKLSEFRAKVGVELSKIQSVQLEYDGMESTIKTRQSGVEDANLAEAITQMNQIQTALQASLAAQGAVSKKNLFDFLG